MSKIQIVDTHCHLDYLEDSLVDIREKANDHGVVRFMTIAVEEKQWPNLIEMGNEHDIDVALGIHPCDVVSAKSGWEDRLLIHAKHQNVKAIGETGLDNYHDPNQKKAQLQAFEAHAYVAKTLNKPLVIHMREATADVLAFLETQQDVRGILHCFSEDYEVAKKALDMGLLISFSGIVTFKNALNVQETAKKIPLDRVLLETDAPFLAPHPHRGKRNHPAYTRLCCEKIAELRGISVEEVASQTTKNFLHVIGES